MNCFVKESYGAIWHFYHNSHGICFCKMIDENITEYQVLIPDGQEDFDVIVDDSNCIHMVFQNGEGDILYANHFNGQWKKTTLMQSKNRTHYNKNIVVKRVGNWLNLLYCIEYNGKQMLTHQIIGSEECTPYVIDCIKEDFCVAQDTNGNIYVLFYSETKNVWGIRKYIWSQKNWDDFKEFENLAGCKNPFLFMDKEDKIHIVFEREFCIFEFFEGQEKMLGTGQKPIMIYSNLNAVIWEGVTDNKIYIKKDVDNTPTVFMSGGFAKPTRFKLRYTTYETSLIAECCTGNIINGSVRTYGINNFFVVSQTSPVSLRTQKSEDFDDVAYKEMQKLKIKISQLNSIIEGLQSKISEYEDKKIDHRLYELETAVNKSNKPKLFSLF